MISNSYSYHVEQFIQNEHNHTDRKVDGYRRNPASSLIFPAHRYL